MLKIGVNKGGDNDRSAQLTGVSTYCRKHESWVPNSSSERAASLFCMVDSRVKLKYNPNEHFVCSFDSSLGD